MKKIISMCSVLGAALALPLAALANPPAMPVLVYGDVTINGSAAPVGTVVTAKDGSTTLDSFTLTAAGQYALDISADVPAGTVLKLEVNSKPVTEAAGKFKMVDVATMPSVEYDLAIHTSSSSSSSGGPATPAKPADPKNDVPAVPAIPATPALDANGQVKDASSVNVLDGDIIQCKSSADPHAVYIVKIVNGKKYIRHIVSLQIFNHYKHLQWGNLIQVASLDGFSLSGWVRVNTGANGNPGAEDKVYEINGDQTRHWIDMTAAEFLLHGGSDEAIFNINAGELNLYGHGPAVRLQ